MTDLEQFEELSILYKWGTKVTDDYKVKNQSEDSVCKKYMRG